MVAPASAATITVASESDLTTALAAPGSNTVVLSSSITVAASTLEISSTSVVLDLAGFNLIANNITVDSGSALTIADSSDSSGVLLANASTLTDNAGIQVSDGASLDITGGTVTADGGQMGAGIGGTQFFTPAGAITIDGGTVHAFGGGFAAGIGGGRGEPATTVTINGGTVSATGGGNGGSDGAAGIGSGSDMNGVAAGTITINGGTVTATGGTGVTTTGAGIGGGSVNAPGGDVTITAGTVNAFGGSHSPGFGSAGIGGSDGGSGGSLDVQGGTVTAIGGVDSAGVGGSDSVGATVTVEGGSLTATGGFNGAGIGGGFNENGGSFTSTGGTISATGGFGAAAIGGGGDSNTGAGGNGANVAIDFGSSVTVASTGSPAIGGGGTNNNFGSLVIGGDLTLNSELLVPSGFDATVEATGVIQGTGTLDGDGNVINHGIIKNASVTDVLDTVGGLTISDHDYLVEFDGNDASATPAFTGVRLYATTFATGNRTIPTVTRTGWAFGSWNSAADGSGNEFVPTSGVSGDRTVYAKWTKAHLVVTPSATPVEAGTEVTFTAEEFSPANVSLGDVTGQVTFSTNQPSDTIDGANPAGFTLFTAGSDTITATLNSDADISGTVDVTVTPAFDHIQTLTLTPSQTLVKQGGTVTFTTSGTDIYGNSLGNANSHATLTSNFAVDQISGNSITFPHASSHIITSTIGATSTTVTITVDPVLGLTGVEVVPAIATGISLLGSGVVLLVFFLLRRRRTT